MVARSMDAGRLMVLSFAGLQAGVFCGLLTLLWYFFVSLFVYNSFWMIPNVFAAVFYQANSIRDDFGFYTCSGMAIHVLFSAIAGMVYAWIIPESTSWGRSLFFAFIYAVLLHGLCRGWIWNEFNPWMRNYIPLLSSWIACIVFGFGISIIPYLIRSMQKNFLLK